MDTKTQTQKNTTLEDVKRVHEVGKLLFSVLTPEEIEELQIRLSSRNAIGNTGGS